MKSVITAVSALALAVVFAAPADAGVRVGQLRCWGAPKVGAIIGSIQPARCVFLGVNGRRERYAAQFARLGADLGVTNKSELVWDVYAETALRRHARALVGSYVGASADAAIGVGGGANVLVGGNAATVSLQPVSVKAETGLAVGAGLGQLTLR
jgi:hypothetical protein